MLTVARPATASIDPLLGLTLGLLVSVVAYALAFAVSRRGRRAARRPALARSRIKLVAGVLVGLSTWGRWAALDDATVGVVLALNLLSIPVVLFASPLVAGRHARAGDRPRVGAARRSSSRVLCS